MAEQFGCDACGKHYVWKPQLAGKQVKCKCGHVMHVPAGAGPAAPKAHAPAQKEAPVAAAPPPPPPVAVATKRDEDGDDLYDFAPEPERPKKAPVHATTPAVGLSAANVNLPRAGVSTISYQRGLTQPQIDRSGMSVLIDMKRDCYVPVALIIVGFLLYVGYYTIRFEMGGAGIAITTAGLGFVTALKAALLIGFALVVATPLGVSFGGVWTCVLKLAAISVFVDGTCVWIDAGMAKISGPMGAGGGLVGWGVISYPVALGLYWVLLIYLFSMDPGDSWMVVMLLSVFDRIVRIALLVLLVKLILSWGGVSAAAAGIPSIGGSKSIGSDPMIERVTELQEMNLLREAREYIKDGHQAACSQATEDWYAAGAKNVWFEIARGLDGKGYPTGIILELPDKSNQAARDKCYQILAKYYSDIQITPDPRDMKDRGKRYIDVEIRSN
jgi:hypothetical protein